MGENLGERATRNGGERVSQLKRRGLVAGMAALAAGGLAKMTATTALAGTDGDMVLSANNNSGSTTQLSSTGGGNNGAFRVVNTGGHGVTADVGNSTNIGVYGVNASNGVGVRGDSNTGQGLYGNSVNNYGVFGNSSSNVGVYGNSGSGPGVFGTSSSSYGIQAFSNASVGCFGQSGSNYGHYGFSNTNAGVFGQSGSNYGVYGVSGANVAIYGNTNSGTGLFGHSDSNVGVYGDSNTGIAVFGTTHSASQYAARFDSATGALGLGLFINGSFTATGTKSAIVPHPDGSMRRLYCTEAPEAWFEDFGEATIANGRATVNLDPDFAAVVQSQNYLVFLTSHSSAVEALAVTSRTPNQFVVEANGKGQVDGTFAWRIVAKRRDQPGIRFERVPLGVLADRPAGPEVKPIPAPLPGNMPALPAAAK
jgi:hypothetical protein